MLVGGMVIFGFIVAAACLYMWETHQRNSRMWLGGARSIPEWKSQSLHSQ